MQKKPTDELNDLLENMKPNQLEAYFKDNGKYMADEKKKEKDPEGKPEEPKAEKPKGNNKFMFIGLIAGVLIINTLMAFFLVQMTSPKKDKWNASTKNDAQAALASPPIAFIPCGAL